MTLRAKMCLSLLGLFALYLPFLNQALHMSDPFFLAVTDQILKDWFRPFSFNFNSAGSALPVFRYQTTPPLQSYFFAGIVALFGHREWVLHLFSFLFVALFFLGAADLGKRFGVSPLWAGLLAALTPAVLVTGHTLMPDLSLAAFFLLSLACFIRGMDSGKRGWRVASGLCASAACLLRYTGLILLPLLALYAVLRTDQPVKARVRGTTRTLAIPVAVMLLWTFWNIAVYGSAHLVTAFAFTREFNRTTPLLLFFRFMAVLHYVGGATIFPLSLILLGSRKKAQDWILLCMVLLVSGLFGLFLRFKLDYTPWQTIFSVGMLAAAQLGIEYLLLRPLESRSPDDRFLAFWFTGVFFFCIFQYNPGVRSLLLLLPSWILLYLRREEAAPGRRRWIPATAAATAVLGLCVSWADYSQAEVYRQSAHRLAGEYRPEPGRTLWCSGHWGFQYYMEREGAVPLDMQAPSLKPGDRVIIASQPWPQVAVREVDAHPPSEPDRILQVNPDLLVVTSSGGPVPLRTVSRAADVNFHSTVNYPGAVVFLPYGPSRTALEAFVVAWVREPKAQPREIGKDISRDQQK